MSGKRENDEGESRERTSPVGERRRRVVVSEDDEKRTSMEQLSKLGGKDGNTVCGETGSGEMKRWIHAD